MVITEDQRLRNNQQKREARLKKKEQSTIEPIEPIIEPTQEPEASPEDIETKRKNDIADKRRITLAKAREKIRDRNDVKKENTDKLKLLQDENIRLKELSKVQQTEQKKHKSKKYIKPETESETESESEEEPVQRRRERKNIQGDIRDRKQNNNLQFLTHQTYAEQLKKKLNDNMINTIMNNSFN